MDDNDDHYQFFRRNNNNPNARIMLTAIISLSFVIVLITLFHIYARCALRRQARRREALRRLGFTPSTGIVHTSEAPKTGLDETVIASLPKFLFKLTNLTEHETGSLECAVCLSFFEDGDVARSLPNCKHTFHADCIDQWLGTNSTCPICRTGAEPRLVPEPREVPAGIPPSAPPIEGTSDSKVGSSSTRLSSFRRMISRERSSRRIHVESCGGQEDGLVHDIERQ